MEDTDVHKELRKALVKELERKGIKNENILKAIEKVPRHVFIPIPHPLHDQYADIPLDIGHGQTISQPYTVAYQTLLLDVQPGDKVLEIGTGSGYQSAILQETGAIVYTVERQKKLYTGTKALLEQLHYSNVHVFYGDGNLGIPEYAPYDKILVTAAAPEIPKKLLQQLKEGGAMVVPVNGDVQKMLKVTRLPGNFLKTETAGHFRFVPLLQGIVID